MNGERGCILCQIAGLAGTNVPSEVPLFFVNQKIGYIMKRTMKARLALACAVAGLTLFAATPALANWPGYYNYIGAGDGDIVSGSKDSYNSGNAYNIFESGSEAKSVTFWVDHDGVAKTAQYSMAKGSERTLPYKDSNWSGDAMLRGKNNDWFAGEQMVRGSVNFDS